MPTVRIWGKGQLTIPAPFRRELGLEEDAAVSIVKVGDALVLSPRRVAGDSLAQKVEKAMKQRGITLEELLSDLKKERRRYNKERYGR